jgi:hypothetical protein
MIDNDSKQEILREISAIRALLTRLQPVAVVSSSSSSDGGGKFLSNNNNNNNYGNFGAGTRVMVLF